MQRLSGLWSFQKKLWTAQGQEKSWSAFSSPAFRRQMSSWHSFLLTGESRKHFSWTRSFKKMVPIRCVWTQFFIIIHVWTEWNQPSSPGRVAWGGHPSLGDLAVILKALILHSSHCLEKVKRRSAWQSWLQRVGPGSSCYSAFFFFLPEATWISDHTGHSGHLVFWASFCHWSLIMKTNSFNCKVWVHPS